MIVLVSCCRVLILLSQLMSCTDFICQLMSYGDCISQVMSCADFVKSVDVV